MIDSGFDNKGRAKSDPYWICRCTNSVLTIKVRRIWIRGLDTAISGVGAEESTDTGRQ